MKRLIGARWGSAARRLAIVATLAVVLVVPATVLAGTRTLSHSRTFTLHAHTTATYNVPYPAALKYKGARYSCTVHVSGPGKSGIRILSRGSALGGTVCRVRARNTNKFEDPLDDARIKVTATTRY